MERKLLLAAMAALRAALRMRACCTRGLFSSYPDSHSLSPRVYVSRVKTFIPCTHASRLSGSLPPV